MRNFRELEKELIKDPEYKREYDKLELEFKLVDAIIRQRHEKGVTQKELAKLMGTKQTAISRFESGTYNPSLKFLKKLTEALGGKLEFKLN